ncbi:MFS transporter [Kocuria coralli]|uniref:MFS transporter n=1 Tax=Kocuria coralli TaxID=1461025 RepID=A0A5J5KTJ3_9MICC|nr:MFS transporter [Kocuria coralli]
MLIGARGLRRPPQTDRARIGAFGALLVTAAFTLTTYVLSSIGSRGQTWWLLALVALIVAAAAILHQSTAAEPLIPRSLWRNRTIVVGNVATFVAGMVFQVSIWYFLTYLLQHRLGLAPALTGLAFLPLTLTMLVINTWVTPHLIERYSPRKIATIGALVSAVGLTAPAVLSTAYPLLVIFVPALIIGIGAGLFHTPLAGLVTTGVTPAAAGAASGMMNTAKQFGGAIGLALLAAGTAGPSDRSAFVLMAGLMLIAAVLVMVTPSPQPSRTPER